MVEMFPIHCSYVKECFFEVYLIDIDGCNIWLWCGKAKDNALNSEE